jgi:hypothetical protein
MAFMPGFAGAVLPNGGKNCRPDGASSTADQDWAEASGVNFKATPFMQ